LIFPSITAVQEKETEEFFDEDFQKDLSDSKRKIYCPLPEFDPYGEAKIIPFSKILDMDILVIIF
jgi:hypothetical protein